MGWQAIDQLMAGPYAGFLGILIAILAMSGLFNPFGES
jgi:hypothetical protein